MKKYIPHIVVAITIVLLLIALGIQSNRLERHKTKYANLETKYASYKESQAKALLDSINEEAEKWQIKLKNMEESNEKLQEDNHTLATARNRSEWLRQQDANTLRKLTQSSNTSEDAREALRVCTNMYAESSARDSEMERRASIYAGYADRLEIELRLCK